jgi:hypothetical protein
MMLQLDSIRQALKVAADQVRALPDEELVALALRSSESPTKALREEIARKPRRSREPNRPQPARRSTAERAARIDPAELGLKTADGPQARVLARLLETAPATALELKTATGLDAKQVSNALVALKRAGRARIQSGSRQNARWVPTARQAGARKAKSRARSASDDEEEGAPVLCVSTLPSPPPVPADLSPPIPDVSDVVDDPDAFRDRVVQIVEERGPVRWGDIIELAVADRKQQQFGHHHLIALLRTKRLFAVEGVGLDTIVTTTPPAPPPAAGTVPSFELGVGEKRENCRHYGGCLTRWAKNPPRWKDLPDRGRQLRRVGDNADCEVPARCPVACTFFEPTPKHVHLELAMVGGRHPNAGEA